MQMEFTPEEVACAVFIATVVLCLMFQAARWFHDCYLDCFDNWCWMQTQGVGSRTKAAFQLFASLMINVLQGTRSVMLHAWMVVIHLSYTLLALGAFCLDSVRVFWSLVATPFALALTCILATLTLLCSIPGLLYGLCWAAHDAGELLGVLQPSHSFRELGAGSAGGREGRELGAGSAGGREGREPVARD